MGKKVGKKAGGARKVRKVGSPSAAKAEPQEPNQTAQVVRDGVPALKERRICAHVDKGINLEKVSSKLGSRGPFRCEDCRDGGHDRRAAKGKGKHGKKKGGGVAEGKADSRAIWICLECGQFSCGGIGLPTNPQCHAVRHARQTHHPLVIQVENPHLRWCFPCSSLVPVDRLEENGVAKDGFADVVKLIKQEPPKETSADVEDVWFGSGTVASDVKSGLDLSAGVTGRELRAVRGFVNLGNTCFFNSVMQSLLAIEQLQEYLLKLDGSVGPLTNALKKLFIDTGPGMAAMGNAISPKSLFGCICAKAPQFRGFQQQDSHELLRCLLDGLSAEESSARSLDDSTAKNGRMGTVGPTFVDAIFGGQLSSTVRCVECGHSSVVYEPFLDLSLPVPTKKTPSRKAQPVARNRKTRFPPKRLGKASAKDSKDTVPAVDSSRPLGGGKSSPRLDPCISPANQTGDSVGCSSTVYSFGHVNVVEADFQMPQSYDVPSPSAHFVEAAWPDDSTWLDYLDPVQFTDNQNSIDHESIVDGDFPPCHNDNVSIDQNAIDSAVASNEFTWFDYIGPTSASDDMCVQCNDHTVSKDSEILDASQEVTAELDTALFNGEVNMRSHITDFKAESCNSWEDELPLKVLDSEVVVLPYKDETVTGDAMMKNFDSSSLIVGGGEDLHDFDGFGSLFDEPEVTGPSAKPSSGATDFQTGEYVGNGILAGNTSESDPDEVDDTNSPVSIESCLSHFTKPELLTNEHAWQCENCTKELLKRVKSSENHLKAGLEIQTKEQGDESFSHDVIDAQKASTPSCLNADAAVKSRPGGEEENGLPLAADSVMTDVSGSLGTSDEAGLSCDGVTSPHDSANHVAAQSSKKVAESAECESAEDGEDEKESGSANVKAMRDATKRILISMGPNVLTIHLKRFTEDDRGRFSKLNGHIGFKEMIDLRPFMDPSCVENGEWIYRLVGVVEHSGTMRGGHYVAYVKGGNRNGGKPMWYYASDANVRETSLEDVLRAEAYLLFYEKT